MKKKAIKLATSTAIAASAFVAAAPVNKADAAVNVNELVKAAEATAKVLQWSISTEGTADFVTRPYTAYNAAKKTNKAAKAEVAKLKGADKAVYEARLLDSDLQIKRAGAYIDALTSGEKIKTKQADLDKAIKAADLKKVQSSYHILTAEIRKQAELLYKVYGQSTRDGILRTFKAPAEQLYKSVTNEVTVLDHTALVDKYTKEKNFDKAVDHVEKAEYALKDVKQFKTELTKNLNDVVDALPLTVKSVYRVNSTTVEVKFTKALDVAPVTHFTFDKGLEVSSTKLSDDKKTVTLTVNGEKAGETYTLSYKGEATKSYTAPKDSTDKPIVGPDKAERIDVDQYRSYTFELKDSDGKRYTGDVDVALTKASIAEIVSINGTSYTGKSDTAALAAKATDGYVTVVVKGKESGKVALKITNKTTLKEFTSGDTVVLQHEGKNIDKAVVEYVNSDNDYFTIVDTDKEYKFAFTKNDAFIVEGRNVSYEDFKKSLTAHSKITTTYTKGAKNFFNIVEKVDVKIISVTNPSKSEIRVNPKTSQKYFDLKGTGEPGKYVKVKVGADVQGEPVKVDSSGKWEVRVQLKEGKKNLFKVGQYEGKNSDDLVFNVEKEITVVEGAFEISTIVGKLEFAEKLTFTFNTVDGYEDKGKFSSSSVITFVDNAGEKLQYQIGKERTELLNNENNAVEVKLGAPVAKNKDFKHDEAKLFDISGLTNQDGLTLTPNAVKVTQ